VLDLDPFVRAFSIYGLAERGALAPEVLRRASEDSNRLVRETALALAKRQESADLEPDGPTSMLAVEKMIALRCVPVFAALGPDPLEELARSSHEQTYAPGDALCVEGELGDEVFVLLSGEARIMRGSAPAAELLRVETMGNVIGELAVLDAAPRSASVLAGPVGVRALRLQGSPFRRAIEVDPGVAEGVIRTLARRLRSEHQVPTAP
jgi:hypothetical protein